MGKVNRLRLRDFMAKADGPWFIQRFPELNKLLHVYCSKALETQTNTGRARNRTMGETGRADLPVCRAPAEILRARHAGARSVDFFQ